MFHVGGHKGSRGRSTALSKSYHSIFNNTDWKGPLRCGIQFCTLSCILFVVGVVLTWLGIHDIFGETVPITGPILLTVGALFLILASRQFFLAHSRKKRKATLKADLEAQESKKAVVVDADDGNGPSTIVMDNGEKNSLHDGDENMGDDGNGLKNTCSPTLEPGTYVWPSLPYQPSPFACISMMLGKDPASIFRPPLSRQGFTCAYSPGTTSTSLSPSRPENNAMSPTSLATDCSLQQLILSPTAAIAGHLSIEPGSISSPSTVAVVEATKSTGPSFINNTSETGSSVVSNTSEMVNLPSNDILKQGPLPDDNTSDTGTSCTSNTNPQSTDTTPATIPTSENPPSPVHSSSNKHNHDHSLSSKLPKTLSPTGLPAMIARDGIHNFPNRTAIMMLKTLEIQETI